MTAPWDLGVGHEVHQVGQVGDHQVEVVVDSRELRAAQLVGSQGDHLEVWGPGQGNRQGRGPAMEDHEEESVVFLLELPGRSVSPACLPCSSVMA